MSAAASKTVFIVLFRGVGGATQLPTAPLRKALGDAGFGNVSTYINSGNAVLLSGLTASETHARIADIAKADFGFEKEIMLVSRPDWERLIDGNPFPEAVDQPTTLHAFVLQKVPAQSAVAALTARLAPHEHLIVKGNFLYLHVPHGFSASKLPPVIDRVLDTVSTARNWRTVLALGKLASEKG
jgi:uncharacterized protein (DUF1697 family)